MSNYLDNIRKQIYNELNVPNPKDLEKELEKQQK